MEKGPIMDWDEEKRQFVYEGTVDIVLKSLNEFSERFYDEVNNYFKIKSGLCGPAENNLADAYGVLPYMAPELIDKKQYSKASDIYSLGMLMWEIFAECPPFHDQLHDSDLAMEIIKGERPQMLPEIPEIFQKLIRGCWEKDAKKRPEIEKIYGDVNKEFIKIYENEELMLKYENKRATEFLEIPKSPYPTHHTSSASGMPPIESLTINDYTFIINKNCTHCTSSSLRYGRENDNEKVMYDVTNKSSDVNYLSFSLLLLKKKMTKKHDQKIIN
uniref:Protein kinase domain-containing protein n=1 Tax=Rhizophagus irregularis (strain DAOM 181602 / DAOM 197198 / MUCL 43194) TaxID=747089 RepID=U9TGE0_RHIID